MERRRVVAAVNDELIAAVEGWREANGLAEQADAIGELVRIGLMSEIAKIYRLVADQREEEDEATDQESHRQDRGFRPPVDSSRAL